MPNITHQFVSTLPDGTDPTLVRPSNWNADHVVPTGVLVGSNTTQVDGVTASAQRRYLRSGRDANGITYSFVPEQRVLLTDYLWNAAPGGSLSAGANTITLSPVPLGVNGSDTTLKLYISGGVGAAEVVTVTGGSAVSGAASGTLSFNCANTHSGAWQIGTATGGLGEAAADNLTNCSIYVPAGTYQTYAAATFTAPAEIIGAGEQASVFVLNNLTQDLIIGAGYLGILRLGFASGAQWQTGGSVVKMSTSGTVFIREVRSLQVFNFVEVNGPGMFLDMLGTKHNGMVNNVVKFSASAPSLIILDNIYADGRYWNNTQNNVVATVNTNGTTVTGTLGLFSPLRATGIVRINNVRYTIASIALDGASMTLTSSAGVQTGVSIVAAAELLSPALFSIQGILAGATIANLWLQASQTSINFEAATAVVNEVLVTNCIFDHDTQSAFYAVGFNNSNLNPAASSNSIIIDGCYIATFGWGFITQYMNAITIQNCFIRAQGYQPCVTIVGSTNVLVKGNNMHRECTLTDRAYVTIAGANSTNIKVLDNVGRLIAGTLQQCVLDTTTGSTLTIANNSFDGPMVEFITSSGINSVNSVVKNNDNSFSNISIASAATISLPVYDSDNPITITGTTHIATINGGYPNRRFTALLTGNMTFNTSGNIQASVTVTANTVVTGVFNSNLNKWFIS